MRTRPVSVGIFLWVSASSVLAAVGDKNLIQRGLTELEFSNAIRNLTFMPAKVLLGRNWPTYKKMLWAGKCEDAVDLLRAPLKVRYPEVALMFPDRPGRSDRWHQTVARVHYRETGSCVFLRYLISIERLLGRSGRAGEPLLRPFVRPDNGYASRRDGIVVDVVFNITYELDEVSFVGIAQYLLDHNDAHHPDWMTLMPEAPLYLLARGAVVATRRGNAGNLPMTYDYLLRRARRLLPGARAEEIEIAAKTKTVHQVLWPLVANRLIKVGRPLFDMENLPPFFFLLHEPFDD